MYKKYFPKTSGPVFSALNSMDSKLFALNLRCRDPPLPKLYRLASLILCSSCVRSMAVVPKLGSSSQYVGLKYLTLRINQKRSFDSFH